MLIEMMDYIIERSQGFTTALGQHLTLTFTALGISIVIGIIFGIIATRVLWLRTLLLALGNIGRTIPSLAILALALPLLGIGAPPTILALVFIGVLPILINTIVGIEQVDPNYKEAARGMGMNDFQVLARVEIPIAIAVIMASIRTSAVLVVASATLAAFIGGGGLGDLILRGHALSRDHIMLAGAIPATLLAFYFEESFGRLEKWVTPKGLKLDSQAYHAESSGFMELLSAVFILPLVFGYLMPWETYTTAEGIPSILTGMHLEYRPMATPILLLGIITVLWPQGKNSKQNVPIIITTGASSLGLVWMVYVVWDAFKTLPAGHNLQAGIFLQLGAVFCLAAIAMAKAVQTLRVRRGTL